MSAILMSRVAQRIEGLPLKEQDGALLAANLRQRSVTAGWPVDQVEDAMTVAAWAHAGALRAHRGAFPVTSYVEHPLRLALRLCLWGVQDWRLVAAAVLHDVVEDAALDLAELRAPINGVDDVTARAIALDLIADQFGSDVGGLVASLSNPIPPAGERSQQQKLDDYSSHALEVLADPRSGIVKSADLADNALSLHHTADDPQRAPMTGRLARKYRSAVVAVIEHAGAGDYDTVVPAESAREIATQFTAGLHRLDDIITATGLE